MWILLIVTTFSVDPPVYDLNPYATTKTMSECMKLLETYRKPEPNQYHYCIKMATLSSSK